MWGFPKIGDPNIVPYIVGSLIYGPLNRVPLIFGNSHVSPSSEIFRLLAVGPLSFRIWDFCLVWEPVYLFEVVSGFYS